MTIPTTTPGTLDRAQTPIATIVGRLAAISALALTVFGLSVTAASAGESEVIRVKGGVVRFQAHGEIIKATDTRRDQYGVRAGLAKGSPRSLVTVGLVTDYAAGGTSQSKNLSVREGTPVYLQLCYTDHRGNNVHCSRHERAVA